MIHEAAARIARACRRIIQACLREEEWLDAEAEFTHLIIDGMKQLIRPNATATEARTQHKRG